MELRKNIAIQKQAILITLFLIFLQPETLEPFSFSDFFKKFTRLSSLAKMTIKVNQK
tara:strand:+ start:1969 stop:2139 length:171 start_codon:yes stop_codon:yes gene_type:complete